MATTVEETFENIIVDVEDLESLHPRASCSPLDPLGVQSAPTRHLVTSGLMEFIWNPIGVYAHIAKARIRVGDRVRVFDLGSEIFTDPRDYVSITVTLHQVTSRIS